MPKKLFLLLLCFATGSLSAQQVDTLRFGPSLLRLQALGDSLIKSRNDSTRLAANAEFSLLTDSILHEKGSELLSFYQVKALSVLPSPDHAFIIYNWMCSSLQTNQHNYFGYVRLFNKKGESVQLTKLTEKPIENNEDVETKRLGPDEWPGCIYYKVIVQEVKKRKFYLLLGWAPHTAFSTRKIVEPITFAQGKIQFGAPVLKTGGRPRMRMVFEYSAQATMALRWEENKKMVVFDNLSSTDPRPESKGMYSLYGPDMSYNALKFEKGYWILNKDIDIRNTGDTKGKDGNMKKLRITRKTE